MYISSKSIPLSLSCAWGRRTLTHVWSDISIERDGILLTCPTATRAVSGVEVNGEKMPTMPASVQGRENRSLAKEEPPGVVMNCGGSLLA